MTKWLTPIALVLGGTLIVLHAQSGQSGSTLSGGTTTSSGGTVSLVAGYGGDGIIDLDRAGMVWCRAWDFAKKVPIDCYPPPDPVVDVRYGGKVYHLSRQELIDAVKRQVAAQVHK